MHMKVTGEVSNRLAKMSFLCALLVVVMHVGIEQKWAGKGLALTGIAVPAFFLMAGYLFAGRMGETGWWLRQVKSRLRSLVIPYVFWNVAYWVFLMCLSAVLGLVGIKYGGIELIEGLMGARWDVLGLMPLSFSALGLLWFVRCLIVITLVSHVFLIFSWKWGGVLILIGYVGLNDWSISHPDPDVGWVRPWLIRGWCQSVIFFSAGVWLRFHGGGVSASRGDRDGTGVHAESRIPRWAGLVILAMGWGCLAVGGWWFVVGLPLAMGGLWYSLSEEAWPKVLTSCAFPIYVLHVFLGVVVSAVFSALGLKDWAEGSALAWGVKWSVMVGGSIVTTMLARRFLPKMSAVVFGGR